MGCFSAYSQETGMIMYSNSTCIDNYAGSSYEQNISLQLNNDTLTLSGEITANCCGTHFLKYEIFDNSIFLTRIDTGGLCDCYCHYDIFIQIGGCTSNFYNVVLLPYYGIDGICTSVKAEPKIEIYPNPFNEFTTIKFQNPKLECFTFKMYDSEGSLVKTIPEIYSNSFKIYIENLGVGIYYFKLYNSEDISYSGKLIII